MPTRDHFKCNFRSRGKKIMTQNLNHFRNVYRGARFFFFHFTFSSNNARGNEYNMVQGYAKNKSKKKKKSSGG